MRVTPIVIDKNVEKTCVNFKGFCLQEAVPSAPIIRIRRAGKCIPLIEYPGTVEVDGIVCFEWGPLMWELPSGRYVGDLYDDKQLVGMIQFQINPQQWYAEEHVPRKPKPTIPCHDPCE